MRVSIGRLGRDSQGRVDMASEPVWLIEEVPQITENDGLFHIRADIEGIPRIAFRPNTMLRTLIKAARTYKKWAAANGCKIVPLREMADSEH